MAVKVDISRVCTIISNGGGATLQGLIDRVFRGVQRLNTAIDLELRGVDCKHKINYNSSMKNYNKRKRAFTLAEVLITLGIIGVVAALTIPTLISNYQKKEYAARLSKTYSTIAQAVQHAQVDYGDVSTWGYQSNHGSTVPKDEFNNGGLEQLTTTLASKYIIPYLRVTKDFGYTTLSGAGYKVPWTNKRGDIRRNLSGTKVYTIMLNNGVFVFFSYNYGSIEGDDDNWLISDPLIYVDLNGHANPNVFGRDIYLFTLSSSKNKLQPYGADYALSTVKTDCGYEPTSVGNCCAALIQRAGWKITDDYPW